MQKEIAEWIRSWSDNSRGDLPRILLIGDSITEGYQGIIRERLEGQCAVDYIATSYAVDAQIFNKLIELYASDCDYDVIHFNHGLHGWHMTAEVYRDGVEEIAEILAKKSKLVIATSTRTIRDFDSPETIDERNEIVRGLAEKYGYVLDDLFEVSAGLDDSSFADGIHFKREGYDALADSVIESIFKVLK